MFIPLGVRLMLENSGIYSEMVVPLKSHRCNPPVRWSIMYGNCIHALLVVKVLSVKVCSLHNSLN